MICTGKDVWHPPYKTQTAPRPLGEEGGMKCRGRSIDPATLWHHVSVGPALAVHWNLGAWSDRTRLPSHQQYCDLPRYSTLQVQSQPWGGHLLNPLIANKSCRKWKMQSFLSFFNHLIFRAIHAFEQLVEKMGWFCVTFKKNRWCKCSNVIMIENASFTEYSAETKHETYILWHNIYVLI
jgi:hypothetical protein